MSERISRFGAFGSSLSREKAAGAVIACAVMLLVGCGGSGGSSADAGATVIRGDAPVAALSVSNTTMTGTVGTAITLMRAGGSATDEVSFATTDSGCVVSVASLSTNAAGTCTVTVTQGTQTSAAVTFTFAAAASIDQALFAITNTVTSNLAGKTRVWTTGGSGTGATNIRTGWQDGQKGCYVNGSYVGRKGAGFCTVTATKAASAGYLLATSAEVTFTFDAGDQDPLGISNTVLSTNLDTTVSLLWQGGSGTGSVTFSADPGCTVTESSLSASSLSATVAGSCWVTAKKAASTGYQSATSAPKYFTFIAATTADQAAFSVSNATMTGTVGTPISLLTSGGSGTGGVTYAVPMGTACSVIGTPSSGFSLTATMAGACALTATKGASTGYRSATSTPVTFTFCATSLGAWTVTAPAGGVSRTVTFEAPTNPNGWTSFSAKVSGGSSRSGRSSALVTSSTRGSITFTGLTKGANNTFNVTGIDGGSCSYTSQTSKTS